jgi:hypothetical protein
MHKNATKCNETLSKWCKNKHGASKIIDTFKTYHFPLITLGENTEICSMVVRSSKHPHLFIMERISMIW